MAALDFSLIRKFLLNPLDYYLWGVIEKHTNKFRHLNINSLRVVIKAEFTAMKRDQLKTACSRFRTRIEQMIEAQGVYIE